MLAFVVAHTGWMIVGYANDLCPRTDVFPWSFPHGDGEGP
jgi:hypothetical protein